MYMQNMKTNPIISECLTIGIPVRIDSEERKANLQVVIKYLALLQCRIMVLEADEQPLAADLCRKNSVDYRFIKDTNAVFHRTHYINLLLQMAQTEVVGIWDADVLVDYPQIFEALLMIRNGATISYPYDGRFIKLSEEISVQIRQNWDFGYLRSFRMKSFLGRQLCGGAYLVHKQRYLQCGGENEHFTGWGPEDAERQHRVTILGFKACHISYGELFHLYHPTGTNSNSLSKEETRRQREELIKICCMSPVELKSYIMK